MEIKIEKNEALHTIHINNTTITDVSGYKIVTSDSGETEVELKIKLNAAHSSIEMSTN